MVAVTWQSVTLGEIADICGPCMHAAAIAVAVHLQRALKDIESKILVANPFLEPVLGPKHILNCQYYSESRIHCIAH